MMKDIVIHIVGTARSGPNPYSAGGLSSTCAGEPEIIEVRRVAQGQGLSQHGRGNLAGLADVGRS